MPYENFTDRARKVMQLANQESQTLPEWQKRNIRASIKGVEMNIRILERMGSQNEDTIRDLKRSLAKIRRIT